MKAKFKGRRNFIKAAATCCVMSQFVPSVSSGKEIKRDFRYGLVEDSNYIIVNGWVLLKADLGII